MRTLRELPRTAVVVVLVLVAVLPLLWVALSSLKSQGDLYSLPPALLPESPVWGNFGTAFSSVPVLHYLLNSVLVTTVVTSVKVLLSVTSAYALVFLRFPAKNAIFLLIVAGLMVPEQVTLIPNYVVTAQLGWIDSYLGLVVPVSASAFGTFLMRQHFQSLPISVIEAARIDGVGVLGLLRHIVLPMSSSAIAALTLVLAVSDWNSYLWPLLVTTNDTVRTLPVGLSQLQTVEGVQNWGVVMAGTISAMAPLLLLVLIAQRRIVSGLTAGAVK